MKPVRLSALARDDLQEACGHLEREAGPAVLERFVVSVNATIESLSERPELYQVVHVGLAVRRALTRRFPYAVYYRVDVDEVLILAIVHHKRHPDTWLRSQD